MLHGPKVRPLHVAGTHAADLLRRCACCGLRLPRYCLRVSTFRLPAPPASFWFRSRISSARVSADAGKRLETDLWNSWGGPPTTRFLTHGNAEFNAETRLRLHDSLRALGLRIPTAAEQEADPDRARELYASAVDELRRLTRDTTRFPLVFKGNVEYGFRRNLLGMKRAGVGVALTSLLTAGWLSWRGWATISALPPLAIVAFLVSGCILLGWLLRVHADAVKLTADRYARYLLEAAGGLEAK